MTPTYATELRQPKLDKFKAFLSERGAEVLTPTNEWEVLRFAAKGKTSIVHKNKQGRLNWDVLGTEAYQAMLTHSEWSGCDKVKRHTTGSKGRTKIKALIERDGDECFFCGLGPDEHGWTLEHLLSIAHGGRNHIANLALAHIACNQAANHMSVVEKVRLRDEVRADIAAVGRRADQSGSAPA